MDRRRATPSWRPASSCCRASTSAGWWPTDTGATAELPGSSGLVVLDTAVTPELEAEGVARDLVRVVQQARRDAGLDVADRITLTVQAPDEVVAAVRAHEAFVAGETLADSVTYGPATGFAGTVGDGVEVTVAVAKA